VVVLMWTWLSLQGSAGLAARGGMACYKGGWALLQKSAGLANGSGWPCCERREALLQWERGLATCGDGLCYHGCQALLQRGWPALPAAVVVVATRGRRHCDNKHPFVLPMVEAFATSGGGLLRRWHLHLRRLFAASGGSLCYQRRKVLVQGGVQRCYLGDGVFFGEVSDEIAVDVSDDVGFCYNSIFFFLLRCLRGSSPASVRLV
jgi:hypothetical protein